MPRITIILSDVCASELRARAHRARRRPQDQAAVLLEELLDPGVRMEVRDGCGEELLVPGLGGPGDRADD